MIQSTSTVYQILSGQRTQLRQIVNDFEPHYVRSKSKKAQSHSWRVPFQPVVGTRLAVSAVRKGEDPLRCHIILIDVRQQPLGDLTYDDARAMAHRTRDEFKVEWVRAHDRAWVSGEEADRPDPADDLTAELLARFDGRWSARSAWVLTFERDRDQPPRYLAERHARADYTESPARALKGEPAAVDPSEQTTITARAGRTTMEWQTIERARRDAELEQLSLGGQLDRLLADAGDAGIATSKEIRVIEKRLAAIRRQLNQRSA